MTDRNELARDIFTADNYSLSGEDAQAEWSDYLERHPNKDRSSYAHVIADGLIAKGYRKLSLDDATVERAARALFLSSNPEAEWDVFLKASNVKEAYRKHARVMLAAAVEVQGG